MTGEPTARDYHDTPAVIEDVECTLNEIEAAGRARCVETAYLPRLERVEAIESGFVHVFPNTDAALETVVLAILLEARCRSDQDYRLDVPAEGEELRLRVTGPTGTKALARAGLFERFDDAPEPT